jgi:hypothetical protein
MVPLPATEHDPPLTFKADPVTHWPPTQSFKSPIKKKKSITVKILHLFSTIQIMSSH